MLDYQLMLILYVLASICVVYKLAYFIRQTASLPSAIMQPMRLIAALLGTAIIWRVIQIIDRRAWVEDFDAIMQLGWCAILYLIILMVGCRKHVW